jgi:hypothetical protein
MAFRCQCGAAGGCASPTPADYAAEKPVLDLKTYFNGPLVAHGLFTDRIGQGRAALHGADDRHLARQPGHARRTFHLQRRQDRAPCLEAHRRRPGRYTGRADDVVGVAQGQAAGNALNWRYTLSLPVDGKVYEVQFDDWMYLMDERVMLNKAVMSKFGIRLGEVTLSFYKP